MLKLSSRAGWECSRDCCTSDHCRRLLWQQDIETNRLGKWTCVCNCTTLERFMEKKQQSEPGLVAGAPAGLVAISST